MKNKDVLLLKKRSSCVFRGIRTGTADALPTRIFGKSTHADAADSNKKDGFPGRDRGGYGVVVGQFFTGNAFGSQAINADNIRVCKEGQLFHDGGLTFSWKSLLIIF
jgi:hypothetical protein